MLPFVFLGGGAGALAYIIDKRQKAALAPAASKVERDKAAPAEEPIAAALKIDDLKIELGYALLPLVNAPDGADRLTEQIKALRRSLAIEMGFVMPAVRSSTTSNSRPTPIRSRSKRSRPASDGSGLGSTW